jgi:hypothetical protein
MGVMGCSDVHCVFDEALNRVGTAGGCRCFIDVRPRDLRRKLQFAVRTLRDGRDDALARAEALATGRQDLYEAEKILHEGTREENNKLRAVLRTLQRDDPGYRLRARVHRALRQEGIDPRTLRPATLEEG